MYLIKNTSKTKYISIAAVSGRPLWSTLQPYWGVLQANGTTARNDGHGCLDFGFNVSTKNAAKHYYQ